MKKITLIILSAIFLVAFTACSTKNVNSAVQVGGEPEDSSNVDKLETTVHTTVETTQAPTVTTAPKTTKAPEVKTEITKKPEAEGDKVDNKWALFLVNQTHALPNDFSIKTQKVSGNYAIDERAAEYAIKMLDAAEADGVHLRVVSAYRTIQYQQGLFDRDVKQYEAQGMTAVQAYKETAKNVAVPGQSEHNAGLALDILSNDWSSVTEGFDTTKAFKWLSEHAEEYGFIMRYPDGKQSITGINYEPWHYRFVGLYHAQKIKASGLCLEEYVNTLNN